jgi:hypothetical protein
MPGQWTLADVARSRTIIQAEAARRVARHAIFGELRAAFERFPQAASAEEACRLAGIDLAAIDRRLAEIPPEDDVGLQWLVSEYARAVQDGTLMATKDQRWPPRSARGIGHHAQGR